MLKRIYWQLFSDFFKIGAFTLGGGYAMIPIIESEVVGKRRWLRQEEFLDIIAIAQSCPGVFAINMSVFIGYKLRKLPGAISAALGSALPSLIIILLIAMFFSRFQDNPVVESIFRGIRPAVVALIAALQLLDSHRQRPGDMAHGREPDVHHPHRRIRRLPLWQIRNSYRTMMLFLQLFVTFFEIGLFGFGGGYGMLSLIQTEVVRNHEWMSSAQFTNIVAISQMTPGPIGINSATYCGYTAVKNAHMGETMAVLGSCTATFALVLPSFILMILIAKMFLKYMNTPTVKSIFGGLRPAVVGLLAAAALLLMNKENFSAWDENIWQFCISVALFIATFVGTRFLRINPILMICFAGFAGLLLLY